MVIFEGRKISINKIGNLPEGYYFIRKKSHTFVGGPRFEKSKLIQAIKERGWVDKDIVIEEGNLPFLNIYKNSL